MGAVVLPMGMVVAAMVLCDEIDNPWELAPAVVRGHVELIVRSGASFRG